MRAERGSAAIELVLIMPVLLMFLLLAVLLGRLASARAAVDAAARDAARAASIARSPSESRAAGEAAAASTLDGRGITCRDLSVAVDTNGFHADGTVTATVTCAADLSDLTLLHVPAARTITATFREPVDVYFGVDS